MNKLQIKAIHKEISFLEDNMYRYKMAEARTPGSKTGNGVPFKQIIEEHQRDIALLKEGLPES